MGRFNEILNSWTAADDFLADKIESMKTKVDSAIINYGFHINGNESNPSNAVTYLADAVNMRPAHMNFSTGVFDYGSWENAFFMPRPCMLYSSGKVAYYLNPNDYTKKIDGSDSDIENTSFDGNAMMQWGRGGRKIWYKIVPDEGDSSSASFYISNEQIDNDFHAYSFIGTSGEYVDHFYTPIYEGSLLSNKLRSLSGQTLMKNTNATQEISYATANGTGWNTETYGDSELINILLILMGKSIDTQSVFGVGNMSGYVNDSAQNYGMINTTGSMNDKGMFWGKNASSTSDRSGVKIFGMENYWGNQLRRIAGMILDGTNGIKVKMGYGVEDGSVTHTYNLTGDGYINTGVKPSGVSNSYIKTMNYATGMMIPNLTGGSASTYYADNYWWNDNQVDYAFRGGNCNFGSACGAFCMYLNNSAGDSYWSIGSALSFRA